MGGESTLPPDSVRGDPHLASLGAARPPVEEELRRVLPVVGELATAGAIVSVDTMPAEVAARAVEAGARLVNDVSGGLADPAMLPLMARAGMPYVLMHWRGHSAGMQAKTVYDDVVTDVLDELRPRIDAALEEGIRPDCLIVDPGLGFAKTPDHNRELPAASGTSWPWDIPSSWARHASRSWAACWRTGRRENPARRDCGMPRRPLCPCSP